MDDNVLLVVAAAGYCSAMQSDMVASVVAEEEDEALLSRARAVLGGYGNVTLFAGPMPQGSRQFAPYSMNLIDGAVAAIRSAIIDQLTDCDSLTNAFVDHGVIRLSFGRQDRKSVVEGKSVAKGLS